MNESENTLRTTIQMATIDKEIFLRLKENYDGKNPARFEKLIRNFIDKSEQTINKFFIAVDNQDFDHIQLEAHSMKSSSAFLGAMLLSKHLASLEKQVRENNLAHLKNTVQMVIDEFKRVKPELESYIKTNQNSQEKVVLIKDESTTPKANILLVDDDQISRLAAKDILENNGYRVIEAVNGQEAISLFHSCQPNIVLLDVEMPVMNGYEVCQALQQEAALQYIPIIMITGNSDKETVERFYNIGAADFEIKPVNWTIFLNRLKFILRSAVTVNKLEVSEQRLLNAQQIGNIGHWDWSFIKKEMYFSDQFYQIFDIDDNISKPNLQLLTKISDKANRRFVSKQIKKAIANKQSFSFDHVITDRSGNKRIIHQEGEATYNTKGSPTSIHAVVQEVTERRKSEKTIKHLAYHDSLTGLNNRQSFNDQLKVVIDAHQEDLTVAVLYIDIDGFKRINDSLGHYAGDELLKKISNRLVETVRENDLTARASSLVTDQSSDNTIARLGGDEFIVMLTGCFDKKEVTAIAQRICNSFTTPFKVGRDGTEKQYDLHVTSSIGICMLPEHGTDGDILQKNADLAMYHAKMSGKNTFRFYDESMNTRSDNRLNLEIQLRKAIQSEELELYYQPKLDVESGKLVGMEALLRWISPTLGFVSPVDFIPLSEECGLIIPISDWVLDTACKQNKAWQDAGYEPVTVAVNLSSVQFLQTDLLKNIAHILEASHLPSEWLELELTESILMNNTKNNIETLNQFREMGIKISIDDFGTGYSSLSYLKRFPVDYLKIDRSFVMDIGHDKDDEAISSAIIAMAHNLNLKVIAEGVENEQQLEFLKNQNCDEYQGYFFSKPVPAKEMELFLTHKDNVKDKLPAEEMINE